ncbi:MAG: GNAT family N-acetyltransferase [Phenylobacterium zucineum]|nr:MAG: GNAT family N-acetyltransferase [Phenylobacterium zucineum]
MTLTAPPVLKIRLARQDDLVALSALMTLAIDRLQTDFLTPEQVEASHEVMGLDTQLIIDGTYFLVEDGNQIAGCGGWSHRATLFGGDQTPGRNAALLNPAQDAARIRAMYTHPDFARRGVGTLVITTCEAAAAAAGFKRAEMAATLSGEPLYRAMGYKVLEHLEGRTSKGIVVPLKRMGKPLA